MAIVMHRGQAEAIFSLISRKQKNKIGSGQRISLVSGIQARFIRLKCSNLCAQRTVDRYKVPYEQPGKWGVHRDAILNAGRSVPVTGNRHRFRIGIAGRHFVNYWNLSHVHSSNRTKIAGAVSSIFIGHKQWLFVTYSE